MRISNYDRDRVLDATDIVDVIKQHVHLDQKGSRFWGCCPVHNERTASFVVNPNMGIYKCFGCGISGNAIDFLVDVKGYTYVEAVKELAKNAHITLKEDTTPMTAEELEAQHKKEAARAINKAAYQWFAEQITKDRSDAKFALDYAVKRWGRELVDTVGIGYAPGHGAFEAWARAQGYSTDLLIDLGLLKKTDNGKIVDGFFGRIVMPIKSRTNAVIGFIARALSDVKPKYVNTPETILFDKSKTIFGINVATGEATRQGIFYLVEGAPDVYRLQSIGAVNTVASLGTAWSNDQFNTLHKYQASVCFIPDIDPPKDGAKYGPGIIAVMRNGRTAMACGLRVLVKEIVPKDKAEKADADSYITSKAILESIPKEDFVTWYANKQLVGKDSASERAEVLKDVASIVALISDKEYKTMIVQQLSRLFKVSVTIVQNAVRESMQSESSKSAIKKGESNVSLMDRDAYSRYGFYEDKSCYYSLNKDGAPVRWSNFVMQPLFHIRDQINPKRLYKIRNVFGREDIIELKQEDLVSLQRFKLRVEGLGNYIWEAKEEQLTKLKGYLYEMTQTATEITQLGWQKDGFFAYGNGVVFDGQWLPVDDYGIVKVPGLDNYYLPAASMIYRKERKLFQFERKFVHLGLSEVSLRAYTDKMIEVWGDNAKVGICFFLATLFKDIIVAKTKNFPILNLFGPKGSGKSELGHSLMSFFIINNEPPNLSSATDAALADTVAQCANALVHVDEYKNTIELSRREFLKGLYDGVGRTRMNMDRDKKREITAVDCGVILSGQEMPTIDIAIFQRMLYLTFNVTEFGEEGKRKFDELKQMRDRGCSQIVLDLLKYRKRVEVDFGSNYNAAMADISASLAGQSIEDRIFRNWVTPLAIYRTLSGVINVGFDYRDMLRVCVDGILRQNGVCKSTNELASFWQVVDYLHQNGEIFIDGDYRIKYETSFKGKGAADKIIFRTAKPVLYLSTKRVMMLYRKNGKAVGDSTLPVESLRHYLEISKEYLGVKNAVRFKNLSNQRESNTTESTPEGFARVTQTSRTDWALCFDYEMLVDNYGINLMVDTSSADDELLTIDNNQEQEAPF